MAACLSRTARGAPSRDPLARSKRSRRWFLHFFPASSLKLANASQLISLLLHSLRSASKTGVLLSYTRAPASRRPGGVLFQILFVSARTRIDLRLASPGFYRASLHLERHSNTPTRQPTLLHPAQPKPPATRRHEHSQQGLRRDQEGDSRYPLPARLRRRFRRPCPRPVRPSAHPGGGRNARSDHSPFSSRRLAWHASGTYDAKTKTGGSDGAGMRYEAEGGDPAKCVAWSWKACGGELTNLRFPSAGLQVRSSFLGYWGQS